MIAMEERGNAFFNSSWKLSRICPLDSTMKINITLTDYFGVLGSIVSASRVDPQQTWITVPFRLRHQLVVHHLSARKPPDKTAFEIYTR